MSLSWSGHWAKGDGHAPVGIGNPIPRPLTQTLGRVVPFVMPEVEVGEAVH